MPPVGRSGPGMNRMMSSSVASGWSIRWRAAATTSTRLWGAMFVAMPTAMPLAPFTSRFGKLGGQHVGLVELAVEVRDEVDDVLVEVSATIAIAAGASRASVYRDAAGPSSREPKLPCPSSSGSRIANGCAMRTRAS